MSGRRARRPPARESRLASAAERSLRMTTWRVVDQVLFLLLVATAAAAAWRTPRAAPPAARAFPLAPCWRRRHSRLLASWAPSRLVCRRRRHRQPERRERAGRGRARAGLRLRQRRLRLWLRWRRWRRRVRSSLLLSLSSRLQRALSRPRAGSRASLGLLRAPGMIEAAAGGPTSSAGGCRESDGGASRSLSIANRARASCFFPFDGFVR